MGKYVDLDEEGELDLTTCLRFFAPMDSVKCVSEIKSGPINRF